MPTDPDQLSPTVVFSPAEITVLKRLATTPQSTRPSRRPLMLRKGIRAMAKSAGFLGRKNEDEPSVKALWRGYRQLHSVGGMRLHGTLHR